MRDITFFSVRVKQYLEWTEDNEDEDTTQHVAMSLSLSGPSFPLDNDSCVLFQSANVLARITNTRSSQYTF